MLPRSIRALVWTSCAVVGFAHAQSETNPQTEDNLDLPPVTITADPFADRGELESTRPVDVLSGDALDAARAATLGETLEREPGVANSSFGPGAGRVVIRGQSGPRVRVLQSGVGVADVSSVSPDHNVAVEPFRAKQVEILRGPATLLYGSGAIGGVVNVVPDTIPIEPIDGVAGGVGSRIDFGRSGRSLFGHLEAGGGGFNVHIDALRRLTGNLEIPGYADADHGDEHHDEHGEEGHDEADHEEHHDEHADEAPTGILANSDTQTDSLAIGTSWIGTRGYIGASVTQYNTNYGVPGHSHGHGEEAHGDEHQGKQEHAGEGDDHEEHGHGEGGVRIALEQTRTDLKGELTNPLPGFTRIRGALAITDYEHVEIEPSGEPGTVFTNDATEARLELTHAPLAGMVGVLGVQAANTEFSAIGEEAFVPPVDSRAVGIFLIEERAIGPLRLEAGIRGEQTDYSPSGGNPDRDFSTTSLSLGANWAIRDGLNLAVSASRSERAPVAEELYSNGPHLATETFEVGNPNLDAEIANNLDVTLHLHRDRLDIEFTAFINRYSDFIYQASTDRLLPDGEADRVDEDGDAEADGELLFVEYVQDDAEFAGLEAEAAYTWLASPTLGRWRTRVFGDTVTGELDNGDNLPRLTPGRVGVGLDWSLGDLAAGLRVTRVMDANDTAPLETPTDGYTRLDADISRRVVFGPTLVLAMRGRNLTDEVIRDHTSFIKDIAPAAGRSLILEARVEF